MSYLARTLLFETEKAFDTDFPVDNINGARRTNHETDERVVKLHEVKDPGYWDLNVHGFCILNAKTHLDPHDAFTKKKEVQKAYWYEIEALLHEKFPEYSRIESYDCTVRKRDPDFPEKVRLYVDYEQPATRPHSDCSQRGAFMNVEHAFPGQSEFWEGKDFDILNVWRPLIGPNDDWPLALCDWNTINAEIDIRLNDALRRDRIDENSLLHFSDAHEWYYMKNQTVNDLIVFRNADSQGKRAREL
ncbi:hypothetical protein VE03_09670 [Pseudogymnoascus sp. 23342-1-I1]|nr:hypothetical protein VE03_09670 [Pseudogymnoascus sp. 23342-1-I1]